MPPEGEQGGQKTGKLAEVMILFTRLGFTSFGGPAAHIALMEDETVKRRQWLTPEHFMDLVGATNLIPGPNATEMAIHIGYLRAGWPGLIAGGVCFTLPAVLISLGFAWLYTRFGQLPQQEPFLAGIKPAVLAVVFGALWRLGKTALKGWHVAVVGLAVALASWWGFNQVLGLLFGGLAGMLWLQVIERRLRPFARRSLMSLAAIPLVDKNEGRKLAASFSGFGGLAISAAPGVPVTLWSIGLFFLKIGCILYGSGYVLVAFIQQGLVHDLGWLTQQQLLDAVAVGQFTPGPVLSTATFIGYLLMGVPGAAVATVAIFLPSFLFVAALNPLIPRLRRSTWTAAFLDSVNASALALMAVVTVQLGMETLKNGQAWLIALLAVLATIRWKINSTWLVLGGSLLGWGLLQLGLSH